MRYDWRVRPFSGISQCMGAHRWPPLWLGAPLALVAGAACATASPQGSVTYHEPGGEPVLATQAEEPAPAPAVPAAAMPAQRQAGPGSGPALFLGAGPGAAAVGYVSPGVPLRVVGAPQGGRVPVAIEGPVEVRAWMDASRLAGRVQERGRVGGAPGYVGPNDMVRVLGTAEEGLLRIELRPPLRGDAAMPAFEGIYPAARIGARRLDVSQAPGPNPGTPMQLPAGQQVPVYDQPEGKVVATLPSLEPPLTVVVLVDQGAWKGVRVGTGPYVVGFVKAELSPAAAPPSPGPDPLAPPASSSTVPVRLMAEPGQPLWRVRPGTQVTFQRETVAVVRHEALAREMARHDPTGEVDVFVAANEDVAVRGMVPADALIPY
jgi:hypothetical protein